jgi:hypothetical protein
MRTKSLFIAAAALAAGIASSSAQGVYSQNVVGYVNLTLTPGFNLVANPLDFDGTGTNNTIAGVFSSNLPVNSVVFEFNPSTGQYYSSGYDATGKGAGATTNWDSAGTNVLNPGAGCFVYVPTTTTVATVGNVLQGNLSNPGIPAGGGFTLVASQVPLSGGLQTALNYTPHLNDAVFLWNTSANSGNGGYDTYIYSLSGKGAGATTNWSPSEPQLAPGEGFFLFTGAGTVWTNDFIVQ